MGAVSDFPELQMDVLKEVGNIGAGHAATALSRLLDKPVDMQVPRVNLLPFEQVPEMLGDPEQVVIAIFLRIDGSVTGNIFFMLSQDSAHRLLRQFAGLEASDGTDYSELELSALTEIGNILAGSYLTSLADFTGLHMVPSVPSLAIDMIGAILSFGLLQSGAMGDHALLINTKFLEGSAEVEGHFFLIPDPEAFDKIFQALGVPME